VKVIDAVQALGKTRNQANIDDLLTASQAPIATLKTILDQLIGPTKTEVNQSVLELLSVLDEAQSERDVRGGLKPEILAAIQRDMTALGSSVQPLEPIHQLATTDTPTLIKAAQQATKYAGVLSYILVFICLVLLF
jgi:hypothetical protein